MIPPPTYQYFKPLHFCCAQESTTFWIVAQGGVLQQKNRIVKKVDSRPAARLHSCRNELQQKNQCISKSLQNRLPLVVRWRSYIYVVYAACSHHSGCIFLFAICNEKFTLNGMCCSHKTAIAPSLLDLFLLWFHTVMWRHLQQDSFLLVSERAHGISPFFVPHPHSVVASRLSATCRWCTARTNTAVPVWSRPTPPL